jgi:hypothetical protein
MVSSLLICLACLAAGHTEDPSAESKSQANDLAAYKAAEAKVGRDADAHVRLALWCEAHGLQSERLKHLAVAVLRYPAHGTARGLLGLVAFHGRWQSPEAISAELKADEAYNATLAEYHARRARMGDTADAHYKLAMWCVQKGLKPEATAHLTIVTNLDPGHESARKQLGFKKQGNRWVTAAQLAAEKAEVEAQQKADKYWTTRLTEWRTSLNYPSKQAEANEALAAITAPRAVPAIWATFAAGKATHQKVAFQLLGQIHSADSSRALALLAVWSESPEVRGRATEILRRRDAHDFAPLLVGMLRDPELDPDPILFHFELQPTGWHQVGSPGFLYIEGPRYDVLRSYTVDEVRALGSPVNSPGSNYVQRVMIQRERQVSDLTAIIDQIRRESVDDVQAAKLHVRQIEQFNDRIVGLLSAATGKSLSTDPEVWRKWSTEERGYAYDPPSPRSRQDWTILESKPTLVSNSHYSCFAAGTPVHTLNGSRSIESVNVGDQVLTQDPRTGVLGYQPVVAALHNKPYNVLKITLGDSVIKATGIHRFWRVGQGWVMARDLKPRDVIRALNGTTTVEAVDAIGAEPVFNLKVLQSESYFVGNRGVLVHDNSLVQHVLNPFDAPLEPRASAK